jgi:hypothetical protein
MVSFDRGTCNNRNFNLWNYSNWLCHFEGEESKVKEETIIRTKKDKRTVVLNSRVTVETEMKFYEIWDLLQSRISYPFRLCKQDVFSYIIEEYYKIIKGEKNEVQ